MKNQLSISIPTPCSENWNRFERRENGGFCSSCGKIVTDFTKMSDENLFKYFNQRSERVCGRFRPDQIKTYIERTVPKINPGFRLLKAGVVGLLLLLLSKPAAAQTTTPAKDKTEVVRKSDKKKAAEPTYQKGYIVSGTIREQGGKEAIPWAYVSLKGTTEGVTADIDGKFKFPRELNPGDVLVAYFIGYETREYTLPDRSANNVDVSLNLDIELSLDYIIMGEVNVNQVYTGQSRIRHLLGKLF